MSGIIGGAGKSGVIGVTGTNNPCFSAYLSSAYDPGAISNFEAMICGNEHFDSAGAYNTSNGIWTCPMTGTYQIDAVVAWTVSIGADKVFYAQLLHEAQYVRDWRMFSGGIVGEGVYVSLSVTRPFNAGEVLMVRGWQNSNASTNMYGDSAGAGCKFSGFRLN